MARLRPFGDRLANIRSAHEIYWLRETINQIFEIDLEHQPSDYMVQFDDENQSEAALILNEIRESL